MKHITKVRLLVAALVTVFSLAVGFAQPAPGGAAGNGGMGDGGASFGDNGFTREPGAHREPESTQMPPYNTNAAKDSNSDRTDASKAPSAEAEVQLYHGSRLLVTDEPFSVVEVIVTQKAIRFIFNMPIDPRTFTAKSIFLNGKPLAEKTGIRFNRSGKLIECALALPKNADSNIEFKNAKSFDGKQLLQTEFFGLRPGMTKCF